MLTYADVLSGRVGADDNPTEKKTIPKKPHTSVERMRRAGDKLTQVTQVNR
jgi:hypothetical protein